MAARRHRRRLRPMSTSADPNPTANHSRALSAPRRSDVQTGRMMGRMVVYSRARLSGLTLAHGPEPADWGSAAGRRPLIGRLALFFFLHNT
jgi:hypothetical protein